MNARDKDGRTPVDIALERNHWKLVRMIGELGEKQGKPPLPNNLPPLSGLIVSVDASGFVEGEWSILRVKLSAPSTLTLEGDVEWLNLGEVDGVVELPLKPKRFGRLPVVISARSRGREERRLVWIEVLKRCPVCGASPVPGAVYCWNCGTRLA